MTNILIQPDLMKRARKNGLNASAVARRALKEACERLERIDTGAQPPTAHAPAVPLRKEVTTSD